MKKSNIILAILLIFHLVGLLGMLLPSYHKSMVSLSGMNLILTFVLLLIARKNHSLKLYVVLLSCFVAGMLFEWIGVHTGYLFGNYHYGNVLGKQIGEVPWVIGLNWCSLVICSCSVASYVAVKPWIQAVIASALMVFLDLLIEPVAVKLDYWVWNGGEIPLYNYFCWFFLSLPLTFLFLKKKLGEQNRVAVGLYVIFVLFFGILRFTL